MGKMGRSGTELKILWLLGLVSAPCSCSAVSPFLNLFQGQAVSGKLHKLRLCWSSHKGESSSRRCHWCLHGAVISGTSYLLHAHTDVTLTTQRIRLSVGPSTPPLSFSLLPYPPWLWQMIQTAQHWLTCAMKACCSRRVMDRLCASSSEMSKVTRL